MSPPFFSALVLWDREEKKKEEKKRGRISLEGDRRTRWPRGPFQSAGCPSNSLARVAVQRSGDAARPGNRLHLVRSTEKRERERGGHDDFWAKRERDGTQSVDKHRGRNWLWSSWYLKRHWIPLLYSFAMQLYKELPKRLQLTMMKQQQQQLATRKTRGLSIQISRGMRRCIQKRIMKPRVSSLWPQSVRACAADESALFLIIS